MGLTLFLFAVQFLIVMLFYPIRIGAKGHVSLARDKINLDLSLFGVSLARVRVKKEEGLFRAFVNGKRFKPTKKVSAKQIGGVIGQYKLEGIKAKGNLFALIGAQDAMTTAMLYAGISGLLQPLSSSLKVFKAKPSDTLEIDGRVKIKINILQIIDLISAGMRGNNG